MKRNIISDEFISQLEAISLNMKGLMKGYFGGNHKTSSYGSTVEFADFREYVLGDDIRRIDWNLFSRFEKYFIKLFVDERQMHMQFFIDCSSSMGVEGTKKRETALKVLAALGFISIHNMDKISYKFMYGDSSLDKFGVICGKDAYYRALDDLENIKFNGEVDIEKAIKSSPSIGHNDGLTVIVSDFLTESNFKSAVDYLLYNKREVMLVQILSSDELNPGYNGRNILMDSEGADSIVDKSLKINITRGAYEAYQQAVKDYLADIKNFCKSRGVDYLLLSSDSNIEKLLLEQLYAKGVIK
ncbi:MAG: DUF58 domain-containing protein [Erysipelotrichales bacterium]|nr:DUF58 domain-containing protein [Erysipelotrichales bacterium]